MAQAKMKTTEAVQTGKQEVASYLKEKAPEWKDQMSAAKNTTTNTIRAGVKGVSSALKGIRERKKK